MLKHLLFCFLILCCIPIVHGQGEGDIEITQKRSKTEVSRHEGGGLTLNVHPRDFRRFTERGVVRYSDMGAVGDGKNNDIDFIAAAHAFANQHDLKVEADPGFTYYIGGDERPVIVLTDIDFGTAEFIIDDRDVENRRASIFVVSSNHEPYKVNTISSLKRNQERIPGKFPGPCLVTVVNSNVMHYIRYGLNQNNGSPQQDIFVVDERGNVDMDAPIIWDFDEITEMTVLPIDQNTLTITGGKFTTIANQEESKYNYYSRNIAIRRSNVVVDGLEHYIEGEGDHGAPYGGFLSISNCAYVTVKNTILTGHKTYRTIGSAGKPVSMGSYDLSVNSALNVSFIQCHQSNDIDDRTYWGILGSNYSKNMLYDRCVFSRFDAHKGVANATIRNSTLGHMGINAIGSGTFLVENSTIRGNSIINLRSDYGSTWQGEMIIRNCTFVPAGGRQTSPSLIRGSYSGQHDFGYTCYMPQRITFENLVIDDSNHPDGYEGPVIFSNFNPEMTDASYQQKYPNVITEQVVLNNITTASGKKVRVSSNPYMFRNVEVIRLR